MSSRFKVWGVLALLILITLIPLLMARYVFHHPGAIQFNHKNHGHLLQPRSVSGIDVEINHQRKPLSTQSGKWSLVYDSSRSCCDSACQSQLHRLHQLRIALHNGIERTRIALLQPQHCRIPALDSSISVWGLSVSEKEKWQTQVGGQDAQVIVLDPNLMTVMQYLKDSKPNPIYEDMRVLLHTSQIG